MLRDYVLADPQVRRLFAVVICTFVGTLASREFLTTQGGAAFGALGLGSLYAPDPYNYAGHTNPANVREIRTDYTPKYFAEEEQYMLRIQHDFGSIRARRPKTSHGGIHNVVRHPKATRNVKRIG